MCCDLLFALTTDGWSYLSLSTLPILACFSHFDALLTSIVFSESGHILIQIQVYLCICGAGKEGPRMYDLPEVGHLSQEIHRHGVLIESV